MATSGGAGGAGLDAGVAALDDEGDDGVLGGLLLGLERLHQHEVLGGGLTLGGHLVAGVGDLLLLDLEEHLGGLELVVRPGLLSHDHVAYAVAPGQLLGGLGVHEGREGDQLRVALGVHLGDGGRHPLALGLAVHLALGQCRLGGGQLGLGRDQLGLHLGVALLGDRDLAACGGELGLGDRQLALGRLEACGGLLELRAGLAQVLLGTLELALDLLLLVLEVVGMSRGDAQCHDRDKCCGHAAVSGTGEGTHRGSLCVRGREHPDANPLRIRL